ncbi:MAG: amidohydrolase [Tetrasphaera sp.]
MSEEHAQLATGIAVPRDFLDEHIALYKEFHADPELSAQEHRTAARIEGRLDSLGIEHFRCGGTGVVATIRNGDGPTVAFRADIDGLPIAEETGVDYASTATGTLPDGTTVGTMHGCGHDTHITSALAAAAFLTQHPDRWAGTTVFVFQPGEESAYGAKAMVADGLWDKAPRPEVVLAQHSWPDDAGTVVIRPGNMASLGDSLRVTVTGQQAHGSQPQKSKDPIVAAASMVVRLQTVVSREVDPELPAVVTVGTFRAGTKENIIPETAEFSLNIRTPDQEVRDHVISAVKRIIAAEAMASGIAEPTFEPINNFPRLYNEPEQTAKVTEALVAAFGADRVGDGRLGMGSEDAGWLSDAIGVPGVFWAFGVFAPGQEQRSGVHTPGYTPDPEHAISAGAGAALSALLAYVGR